MVALGGRAGGAPEENLGRLGVARADDVEEFVEAFGDDAQVGFEISALGMAAVEPGEDGHGVAVVEAMKFAPDLAVADDGLDEAMHRA